MSVVKRFVKNNPFLFATMKKGLLYVRYAQSLFETSPYKGLQKKNFLDVVEIKKKDIIVILVIMINHQSIFLERKWHI